MSDILCNILNEFYNDIRPDIAESIRNAIIAANNAGEFEDRPQIISSFSQLITSLLLQIAETQAINTFMTDNVTRRSASRPFFYHMTLPDLLYPEDNLAAPSAPAPLPPLNPQMALNNLEEGEIIE